MVTGGGGVCVCGVNLSLQSWLTLILTATPAVPRAGSTLISRLRACHHAWCQHRITEAESEFHWPNKPPHPGALGSQSGAGAHLTPAAGDK